MTGTLGRDGIGPLPDRPRVWTGSIRDAGYPSIVKATRIAVPVLDGDDVGFVHLVREVLADELATTTDELFLVKVDQWFGQNWLQFSGKLLGALGLWSRRVTVPPFHPNRVVFERHFDFDEDKATYVETPPPRPLHIEQASEANLRRWLHTVSSSGTFIWYSGDTQTTGRGSLMVYVIAGGEHGEWYVELVRRNDRWRMTKPLRSVYRDDANVSQ